MSFKKLLQFFGLVLPSLSSSLLFLAPSMVMAADRCSELIGSCEYYSCIEEERLSCGDSGYALGYGQRYCEKFSAIKFNPSFPNAERVVFPVAGNDWRDAVRTCLQEELEVYFFDESAPKDCSTLRTFAFDSHPRCYTSGPSFCALKPQSVIRIGLTIDAKDLLTAESQKQIFDTAAICDRQLEERIDAERNYFIRARLMEYQAIWKTLARNPKRVRDILKPSAEETP